MTPSYKEDDSFFITVFPPFIRYGYHIKKWFATSGISKFRFIRDEECEKQFWSLEMIHDMYPGVKTITIVVNPWARMKYAYDSLCYMKAYNDNTYFDSSVLSSIPLHNFKDFIASLPDMKPIENFWFSLSTPLSQWTDYTKDGVTHSVDYFLREGYLVEDFKPIQDFFYSDNALEELEPPPDYRKFYTATSQKLVAKIFQEEIEKFGHKF
jgi:hypothetical protein